MVIFICNIDKILSPVLIQEWIKIITQWDDSNIQFQFYCSLDFVTNELEILNKNNISVTDIIPEHKVDTLIEFGQEITLKKNKYDKLYSYLNPSYIHESLKLAKEYSSVKIFTEFFIEEVEDYLNASELIYLQKRIFSLPPSRSSLSDLQKTNKDVITIFYDSSNKINNPALLKIVQPLDNIKEIECINITSKGATLEYLSEKISYSKKTLILNLSPYLSNLISCIAVHNNSTLFFGTDYYNSTFRFFSTSLNAPLLFNNTIHDSESIRSQFNSLFNTDPEIKKEELLIPEEYTIEIQDILSNSHDCMRLQPPLKSEKDDNPNNTWQIKFNELTNFWNNYVSKNKNKLPVGFYYNELVIFFIKRLCFENKNNFLKWFHTYNRNKRVFHSNIKELLARYYRWTDTSNSENIQSLAYCFIWHLSVMNMEEEKNKYTQFLIKKRFRLINLHFQFALGQIFINNLFWLILNPNNTNNYEVTCENVLLNLKKDISDKNAHGLTHDEAISIFQIALGQTSQASKRFDGNILTLKWKSRLYISFLLWTRDEIDLSKKLIENIPTHIIKAKNEEEIDSSLLYFLLQLLLGDIDGFKDNFLNICKEVPSLFHSKSPSIRNYISFENSYNKHLFTVMILKKCNEELLLEKYNEIHQNNIKQDDTYNFLLKKASSHCQTINLSEIIQL